MPETDASSIPQTSAVGPSAATLAATALIDSDHPAVRVFAATHAVGTDDRARAAALYGAGNRHMAYLAPRGSFDDLPLAQIMVDFRQHYPKWLANMAQQHSADFMAEVELEAGAQPPNTPIRETRQTGLTP